jgi:hypothetical protein
MRWLVLLAAVRCVMLAGPAAIYAAMLLTAWYGVRITAPDWARGVELQVGWGTMRLGNQCAIAVRPLAQAVMGLMPRPGPASKVHALGDGSFIIETRVEGDATVMQRTCSPCDPPPRVLSTAKFLAPAIKLTDGDDIDISRDMAARNFYLRDNMLFDREFLRWLTDRYHSLTDEARDGIADGAYSVEFVDHEMNPQTISADCHVVMTSGGYEIVGAVPKPEARGDGHEAKGDGHEAKEDEPCAAPKDVDAGSGSASLL